MGKVREALKKQLKTEYKQDAEDCIKIYDYLLETTGHVWESEWRVLVSTNFEGFHSNGRRFKPTVIGYMFLKGLDNERK